MTTYGRLKTSTATWLNRDDLDSAMDDIALIAAEEIAERVKTQDQLTRADLAMSAQTVALPSDVLRIHSLTLQDQGYASIERVSVEVLRKTYGASLAGIPKMFAIQGNNILLAPYPSATSPVTADLVYWARYGTLAADTDTNWLLQNHFKLYLWAFCKAGAAFIDDPEQEARFERKFAEALESLNNHEQAKARGGGAVSSFVMGAE